MKTKKVTTRKNSRYQSRKTKAMKPLTPTIKTLLTLGFIISIINLLTYAYPSFFIQTFQTIETLDQFTLTANIITAITFLTVFYRIWKSKLLESNTKTLWTIMLFLLQGIFGIYFLWQLDHKGTIR